MNDANDAVVHQIAEIEELSQQIAQAEVAIADADKVLDGSEKAREANAKYTVNQLIIEKDRQSLALAKAELVEFVKKYFIKLMLYSTNQSTLQYISKREGQAAIRPEVNLNAIKVSLDNHECRLCMQHIPHDIEEELKKLVISYEANVSMQTLVGIKSDLRRALDISDYETEKKKLFERIRDLETSINPLNLTTTIYGK